MIQITADLKEELELLLKFPDKSLNQGLKIHHDAGTEVVAAAQRLFDKGVTTLVDGGYLTPLGLDLQEHAHTLVSALNVE